MNTSERAYMRRLTVNMLNLDAGECALSKFSLFWLTVALSTVRELWHRRGFPIRSPDKANLNNCIHLPFGHHGKLSIHCVLKIDRRNELVLGFLMRGTDNHRHIEA